ncbi:MAG: hypothetical protein ACPG32_00490 [Akkermansiaceae bacterium]
MNENTTNSTDAPVANTTPADTNTKPLLTRGQLARMAAPAISLLGYGLIIGLAVTGIGAMAISGIVWLISSAGWFCGFGLLTGGMFLAAATALFLGKLTRAERALYHQRNRSVA